MQPDDKIVIVQNWFLKADEALNDTEKAILSNSFTTAQNRIYYAVFYAVMALGYYYDFITSKHSQLLGWFNKTFIKDSTLDKNLVTYIKLLMITG